MVERTWDIGLMAQILKRSAAQKRRHAQEREKERRAAIEWLGKRLIARRRAANAGVRHG